MKEQNQTDERLIEQIRLIAELPLAERGEAIRQAEVHLRSLLEGDA